MVLHTILEEINKNTEMGIRESHVPITNELLDSIVASFNSDPSTDDFLHHISEVLQIQVVEQDLLLHEVGKYAQFSFSPSPFFLCLFTIFPPYGNVKQGMLREVGSVRKISF